MLRPGVRDALVGPAGVVEGFELAQGMPEVVLVPGQGAIGELTAAGLNPPLHDRVAPHRQLHLIRAIGTIASG